MSLRCSRQVRGTFVVSVVTIDVVEVSGSRFFDCLLPMKLFAPSWMCAAFELGRRVKWPGTDFKVVEVFEKRCEAHELIGEVAIDVGVGDVGLHKRKLEHVHFGVEWSLWEGTDGQFVVASVTMQINQQRQPVLPLLGLNTPTKMHRRTSTAHD